MPRPKEVLTDFHGHLQRIENKVDAILVLMGGLIRMAVDEAAFDAALTEFLSDVEAGMQAVQAKLDSLGTPVDLSDELQQIRDAKDKFNDQVQTALASGGGATDQGDQGTGELTPEEPSSSGEEQVEE
jgi:hypothetical protein